MNEFKNMVSVEWLADHANNPNIKIVDGSWYLPQQNRDAAGEYAAGHIPGAVFFDLDAISDQSTDLPHMMPDNTVFASAVSALGVSNEDHIVVYDGLGLMSAARIWWMFKVFGHQNVSILNGGLPAWTARGGDLTSDSSQTSTVHYKASLDEKRVASWQDVESSIGDENTQILDARSTERFAGNAPEPRAGLASGHITGSFNLPFQKLLGAGGTLKPAAELRSAFESAGIDVSKPVTTSCGSGVTAAILTLGLDELGHADNKLYDGSWAEWGARDETAALIET